MEKPPEPVPPNAMRGERLDSWKEIAAYLKRDVRTAQRWEKQEQLPVHRHVHEERATAYAFRHEIDEWLAKRRHLESDVAASLEAARPNVAVTQAHRTARRWRLAIVITLVTASVVAFWWGTRLRPEATPLTSLSVTFATSERFREWGPEFALSPDGLTVAYSSADTPGPLRLRRIDQLESRELIGAYGAAPFFSPDGRWIGFTRNGRLMKIPVAGGTAIPLGAETNFIGSADWGTDDFIVYAALTPAGGHGLYRAPADGGPAILVATLDGNAEDVYWLTPQSLSDGRIILCTLATVARTQPRFQVVALDVKTGERRVLIDDGRHGLYLGDGVLVYWRDDVLYATRFDVDSLEVRGPHVPAWDTIFERVRLRSWTYAAGTLVYWPGLRVGRRLVWVNRDGRQEPLPLPPRLYQSPRLSPDGQRIAFGIGEQSELGDVWMHDLPTGATVRLTTDGRSGTPLWTPDGTSIVFSSLRANGRDLFRLPIDVATPPEPIHLPANLFPRPVMEPAAWADAGRTLLVRQSSVRDEPTVWEVALDGSRAPAAALPRRVMRDHHIRVSPDGRWIAYEGGDQRTDIYVAPRQGDGRPSWKVSADGGSLPTWSPTGRELFYRRADQMMVSPVTIGDTFTTGPPRPLFEGRFYEADPGAPNYDVAPDGQRFLMVLPGATEGPDRLNVVQGWKTEMLRRLADSR